MSVIVSCLGILKSSIHKYTKLKRIDRDKLSQTVNFQNMSATTKGSGREAKEGFLQLLIATLPSISLYNTVAYGEH